MTTLLQLGVWLISQKSLTQVAKGLCESLARVCIRNKMYPRNKESIEYKCLSLADDFFFQSFSVIWERYHHLTWLQCNHVHWTWYFYPRVLLPRGVPFLVFRYMGGGVVGISQVEVYERVGKSVISVCKKAHIGWQIHFVALKNSSLVIY